MPATHADVLLGITKASLSTDIVHLRGVLPGDHARADRGGDHGQARRAARPEGKRHRRPPDPRGHRHGLPRGAQGQGSDGRDRAPRHRAAGGRGTGGRADGAGRRGHGGGGGGAARRPSRPRSASLRIAEGGFGRPFSCRRAGVPAPALPARCQCGTMRRPTARGAPAAQLRAARGRASAASAAPVAEREVDEDLVVGVAAAQRRAAAARSASAQQVAMAIERQ